MNKRRRHDWFRKCLSCKTHWMVWMVEGIPSSRRTINLNRFLFFHTLADLSQRVDSVKEENLKLRSENQVLGQYIENLMSASSVFQSTSPSNKKKWSDEFLELSMRTFIFSSNSWRLNGGLWYSVDVYLLCIMLSSHCFERNTPRIPVNIYFKLHSSHLYFVILWFPFKDNSFARHIY